MLSTLLGDAGAESSLREAEGVLDSMDSDDANARLLREDNERMLKDLEESKKSGTGSAAALVQIEEHQHQILDRQQQI